jgi:hypothetical protein
MEKTQKYNHARFSADQIILAFEYFSKLFRLGKKHSSYSNLQISEGNQTWSYDKDSDFFATYRNSNGDANFTKSYSGFSFSIWVTESGTKVKISAPTKEQIQKVFQIFDEYFKALQGPSASVDSGEVQPTSTFSHKETLPSCIITVGLLVEIESALKNKVPDVINLAKESVSGSFYASVIDSFGTHSFTDFSGLTSHDFSDTTSEIRCGISTYPSRKMEVSLIFSKTRDNTKLSIDLTSHEPRSQITAIVDIIYRLLRPHMTTNHIFRPSYIVGSVLGVIGVVALLAVPQMKYPLNEVFAFIILAELFYFLVARPLKPYTEFDSRVYRDKKRLTDWFILGVLGFLLFGTLLPLIRKYVLGF